MHILNKNDPFLTYIEGEGHLLSSLIINDDLKIDLDDRLIVSNDIFVSGSLVSNVSIQAGRNVVVNGSSSTRGISANGNIKIMGPSVVNDGSIATPKTIILTKSSVGKNILCKSLFCAGDLEIKGDGSASSRFVVGGKLTAGGKIAAGEVFDVKGQVCSLGRLKVMGIEVFEYGRLSFGKTIFHVFGENSVVVAEDYEGKIVSSPNLNNYIQDALGKDESDLSEIDSSAIMLLDVLSSISRGFPKVEDS